MSENNQKLPVAVWFAEDGEIFISFKIKSDEALHLENHPLVSPAAEGWIRRTLKKEGKKPPTKFDVDNYRSELISKAYEDQTRTETHLRLGGFEDKIYIDLGTSDWRFVEITDEGWNILTGHPPIAFRRNQQMHALPTPEKGGSLDLLKEFINFSTDNDFFLLCSWAINALHPTGPYFHLILTGEKGSTKSSVARLLQSLIHPSSSSLKGLPNNEDILVLEAYHNRIVMIDNENNLGKWLPNALCRLATGTGASARKLYTDRSQEAYTVSRPAIITAHEIPSDQEDLLERSMHIKLQRPEKYITDRKRKEAFKQLSGKILGAIFDVMSSSLANMKIIPHQFLTAIRVLRNHIPLFNKV